MEFKDAQYLQIASEEGVSQHRTALLGKAVACRQTFACVHAPHGPQSCTSGQHVRSKRLSITARMRRFNIATTPALQDGIAKELSEAGLLASGEQREPRLPEYEDVASKLPYLSAVRMLPLMLCLHTLCLTAAHVHA